MGIKTRITKLLMGSIGVRQFQQVINEETKLTEKESSIKSNEESPTRFEIVFEAMKYPSEKIKLFSSMRSMRYIPSNMKNTNKSLKSVEENPKDPKTEISSELIQEFETYAKSVGVASIGYTKLPRKLIFTDKAVMYDNAVVLSLEMDKEKIELAPSSKTSAMIMQSYDSLGKASNRLAEFLRSHGYSTHAGHPLGGLVLYPPLAEKGGIGYHGQHGLLITPEHGPRVRLTAIFTSIENLPFSEKNSHEWIQHFCQKCGRCVRKCPGLAFYDDPIQHENGLITHIKNDYCFPVFLEYHGCSICIKECPFSRIDYQRLKKQFDEKNLDPEII